jgi:5-hydroxyisourate hydrolase-like protein (transthyretin family)
MSNILRLRWAALLCWLLIVAVCLSAGEKKKKPPEPVCTLSFVVLKDSDGTPIKNASVVLHFLRQDGSQEREGLQLKTNADGRASIEDIPYGKLRLQVVAHRLQTYGDDVEVNQAKQEFVIRLKPPAAQVSIDK